MKYSPKCAVLWFLVPLANLVIPYNVMKEIWHVSHKDGSISHSPVSTWWALHVTVNILFCVAMWRTWYCGDILTIWGAFMVRGLAMASVVAELTVVTRIAAAYVSNYDTDGTADLQPIWASFMFGGTRIAAFLAKVRAATESYCSFITNNISKTMIIYTIGLSVLCVCLWTVITICKKPQMPVPMLCIVETNSPIFGADNRLTESIGFQVSDGGTFEIVPAGTEVYDATRLTITTVANDQDSISLTLYRGNNRMASRNHALGSFLITGISHDKDRSPIIGVLFLISSGSIVIAAQDLTRLVNLTIVKTNDLPNETHLNFLCEKVEVITRHNYCPIYEVHGPTNSADNYFDRYPFNAMRHPQ